MDIFKLKVIVGDAQIELEGAGELVHTIFQELRDNGLGQLTPHPLNHQAPTDDSHANTDCISEAVRATVNDDKITTQIEPNGEIFPTLENIVLTGGPSKETEWLLIYATYCSRQGTSLFSRDELRSKYDETNRMTPARSKNFATNLKSLVTNKFITAVKTDLFRLESAGLAKAKTIISGGSEEGKANKKGKSAPKKKTIDSYSMVELNLPSEQRASVKEFWGNHTHASNMDKAVLAAYWLKTEKQIEEFTSDLFFTILRTVGEGASFNLGAAIRNAKKDKSYFVSGTNPGAYKLSHIGDDYVATLIVKEDNK